MIVDRRFRGAYCLHHLWNVGWQSFYTAVHPRRQIWTSYSPPWELEISLIALMMEAARTSETSVGNYFTRQYIPEDNYELHTRRRENLKSHLSPWWWRQHVPLKRRSTIILHGSTSQKTNLNFILAAVRTWNLTNWKYRRCPVNARSADYGHPTHIRAPDHTSIELHSFLAYFPKTKVGLSNHQSVSVCVSN
jgi:hypothetical protein